VHCRVSALARAAGRFTADLRPPKVGRETLQNKLPASLFRSVVDILVFSVAVTVELDQRSYSTLGPVSAWVGDRLWTGKPPRRRTRHPGLLSLSLPSVSRLEWVPGESWGSKQAYRVIHQPVSVVSQCSLNAWLKRLASGDQRRLTGSGSALEVYYTLMRYTNTRLLYLLTLLHVVGTCNLIRVSQTNIVNGMFQLRPKALMIWRRFFFGRKRRRAAP